MRTHYHHFFFSYALILLNLCLPSSAQSEELSLGLSHSCITYTTNGAVKLYCWGDNTYGQLGVGNTAVHRIPTEAVIFGFRPLRIAAGGYHTCMEVDVQNMVLCWGANGRGQIGIGNTDTQAHPYLGDTGITYALNMATGFSHSCAIVKETLDAVAGTVQCWGANDQGQIGDNTQGVDRPSPQDVLSVQFQGNLSGITNIAGGYTHTCAVYLNQTIYCWGSNNSGELGTGNFNSPQLLPARVVGLQNIPIWAISAGNEFTCAIVSNNSNIACWGSGKQGELGNSLTLSDLSQPGFVGTISKAFGLTAGNSHACALVDDETRHATGKVYCWGSNIYGQLGMGKADNETHSAPELVLGLSQGVTAIAAGGDHTCAIIRDEMGSSGVRCWGRNDAGQLGTGDTRSRNTPTLTQSSLFANGDPLFISTFE